MWKINNERSYKPDKGKEKLAIAVICVVLLCGCGREELIPLEEAAEGLSGARGQSSAEGLSGAVWQSSVEDQEALRTDTQPEEIGSAQSEGYAQEDGQDMIYVHVCGAVKEPGVVRLPFDSRAVDAVLAAGGFCEEADTDCVNLAAFLTDGEQLYIPTKEEAAAGYTRASEEIKSGLVNLNTADADTLCTLPGIGESRARDIIAYREQHGGFTAAEELMQVSGIKESIYEKLKELITVK